MSYPATGLVHRYETTTETYADGTTMAGSNVWHDRQGSNDIGKSGGAGSATWKTNILNGIRALRYVTGAGDNLGATFSAGISTKTIALVVIPRTNPQNLLVTMNHSVGGCYNNWNSLLLSSLKYRLFCGVFNGNVDMSEAVATGVIGTAAIVIGVFRSSGTCELWVNGVQAATGAAGALASDTSLQIGRDSTNDCDGQNIDYFAALVYNVAVTGSDMTDLYNYLYSSYIVTSVAYTDTLLPASYTLTGQAMGQGYGQTCSPASYTLTGQSVTEVTGGGLLGGHGGAQWTPQPGGRR